MRTTILLLFTLLVGCITLGWAQDKILRVEASGFTTGANMSAPADSGGTVTHVLADRGFLPYTQQAVHNTSAKEVRGQKDKVGTQPFLRVRYALPIPPCYTAKETAPLVGVDYGVYVHNHSPGFEMLPNGDALAVYFSAPKGLSENDTSTTFVQARRRFGAEEWDMPELFFDTRDGNDQSGLLWQDGGKLWFFGGGRAISSHIPFRMATSDDNGATWTFSVPKVEGGFGDYTPQPVTNAFRDNDGAIYMATDGKSSTSMLWRSSDEGLTWHDMGGRTQARHSTIVPLDDKGTLLSIGGKNASRDGWTPQNISRDYGATWEEKTAAPFPILGSAQRPSLIRLQSGALLLVSDGYLIKKKIAPPESWGKSYNPFVAISKDDGKTWHYKELPYGLPHRERTFLPTLGYSTVRQAPDGTICVLATVARPGYEYEFNEEWIYSDDTAITPAKVAGKVSKSIERYPDGKKKAEWSGGLTAEGRYLLDGKCADYYPSGNKQHEATYDNGLKTGTETLWAEDGTPVWKWERDRKTGTAIWTKYHPNGTPAIVSYWNLNPIPRDVDTTMNYIGYEAHGPSTHYDPQGNVTATYNFVKGELVE
ncbi:MAG: exo-alpha-sialidase [Muribaculaceae bacterium]|nr:exo-alpha-sialidase [Muribaculaceae bacterium]